MGSTGTLLNWWWCGVQWTWWIKSATMMSVSAIERWRWETILALSAPRCLGMFEFNAEDSNEQRLDGDESEKE